MNSPEIKAWLGSVVGKEAEDLSRHDKWLCMMYPRLRLLKEFLSDNGIILISIDENEVQSLKFLCDELFGRAQRVGKLIWKRRSNPDSRNKNGISEDHEYVVSYGSSSKARFSGAKRDTTKYSNPDGDPRGPWMSDNLTGLAGPLERPNLHHTVVHPITGEEFLPHPTRGWAVNAETMARLIAENRILWSKKAGGRPRIKRFQAEAQSETTGFSTILSAPTNETGTRELNDIFGDKVFAFPKPSKLIRLLIEQTTEPGDFVLDAFAGSGTTAVAALQAGELRKFILV